ncbi:uncharacterized protein aunip [Festucalex cinctus]
MKTSKGVQSNPAPEECGVWLDTVELKGKAKQKKSVRPISKMLNPLANGPRYSLAVVFNFTQTKTEMPRTKQSSISSYFSPRNKSVVASGGKRINETDGEMRDDVQDQDEERNIHCGIQEQQPDEMEENIYREGQRDEMQQISRHQVRELQPYEIQHIDQKVREKQPDETECKVQEDKPDQISSSQTSSVPLNQILKDFDISEEAFRMEAEGKTSTQKPLQLAHSPHDDDEKENNLLSESFSPPKKRARKREDEDSLARMFTQDSDGFRVIAHRAWRSPLKNHNNKVITTSMMKPTKTFTHLDALFTQDSQGNMVIKH